VNLAQLWKERDAAGGEYAKAVENLRAAFVRLGAVERTLRNGNVGGGEFKSFHYTRNHLGEALRSFQHMEYACPLFVNEWHDPIVVVSDAQIHGFKP
jgi:hypothetical protein